MAKLLAAFVNFFTDKEEQDVYVCKVGVWGNENENLPYRQRRSGHFPSLC